MMRYVLATAFWLLVMVPGVAAGEQDGSVVWSEEFNGPQLSPLWNTYFWNADKERKTDREIILKLDEGVLGFSCNFEGVERGYAAAVYGSPRDRMVESVKPWPGVDVGEAPVLEMRFRRMTNNSAITLIVNYEAHGGEHSYSVAYLHGSVRTKPGEWATYTANFYNDPKISGLGGVKRITGIQIYLGIWQQQHVPAVARVTSWEANDEIDYIRLRRMTAEEWAQMDKGLRGVRGLKLDEFKMQPVPRIENFFAVGFYGAYNAYWGGGHEAGLDRLARNWCNIIYPAWAGRFGDRVWRWGKDGIADEEFNEADRATYWVQHQKEGIRRAEKYGFYSLLNMEGFIGNMTGSRLGTPLEELDIAQLSRWADEVTSAMKDEETVLGWYIADEPSRDVLPNYLVAKQMLETRDRSRVAVCLFSSPVAAKAFAPHQQIMLTDRYVVLSGGNARDIADWMKKVRQITAAPHWITLECVRVPGKKRGVSAEEFRLEAWLAIAGGAKGINYYIYHIGPYWYNGGQEGMVDPYGNPHPTWYEFEKFAEKIAPLGELLVNARVDEDARVKPFPGAVEVGMLKLRDYEGYVVVPVNPLLTQELDVKLSFSDAAGKALYDLVSLQETKGENGRYTCGKLQPGEGHAYFWGSKKEIPKVRDIVLRARAKQAVRVAGLDVRKGERHNIQVDDCRKQLDKAREYLKENNLQAALKQATSISKTVEKRLLDSADYVASDKALAAAGKRFAEIDQMLDEILVAREDVTQLRFEPLGKAMIELGERYNELKGDFFWGRTTGLAQRVKDLRKDVEDFTLKVEAKHKVVVSTN